MQSRLLILGVVLALLSGCGPSDPPNTHASAAVQQANKVGQGVIVGVRQVGVSAAGTVGAVSGSAAGGIAGSQVGVGPVGSLVGGLAGSAAEHASADTTAFEYIVRKPNGDLVSVAQRDKVPLALGEKVLVIAGNQARVVPDDTVPPEVSTAKAETPVGVAKPADTGSGVPSDAEPGEATPGPGAESAASAAAQPAEAQPASPIAPAAVSGGQPAASELTPPGRVGP